MQKEVTIPIYDALVILAVDKDVKLFLKSLKDNYGIEEKEINCKGMVGATYSPTLQTKIFYIYISADTDKKDYLNTIGHELVHITQDVLEARQVYFKRRDANEAYAYLQGYLFAENIEFWEKAYKKYNTIKK